MKMLLAIYFIIFLEGYIVLSSELLAIRLLIPFTGSGTDTVSIIIAAVLLPLACGYYFGGRYNAASGSVRKKLVSNLLQSAALLSFGLSYAFLDAVFDTVRFALGLHNRLALTALYSAIFIIYPVYLLGQTVPLISNYFSHQKLAQIAGKVLFFSTLGSFAGAIFSTLIFMTFLGVHHTASITVGCMFVLAVILSRRKISLQTAGMAVFFAVALVLNSSYAMDRLNIVSNNKYSTLQITEDDMGTRYLMLNRSTASAVFKGAPDTVLDYTLYIEENFLQPVFTEGPEKSVLILGAGGFTIGRQDTKNKYVYVDIDEALKEVSEEKFLMENLTPNKTFVPMDARAYLIQSREKFDVIVLDLFRDPVSVHENLNTLEFFTAVREHLSDGGVMVGNYWASPVFADQYSRNLDHTLRAAFPALNRQVIDTYNAWKRENDWRNIIYSYIHYPDAERNLYTDVKNTIVFDKPVEIGH